MPTIKINGGIINDQMLAGSLRFFKMTGPFANTVSNGSVLIPGTELYANNNSGQPITVGEGDPVAKSAADAAFRAIMEKCTVVQIGIVGAPGAETAIHFAIAATAVGWEDDADMQAGVTALGTIDVPDTSISGTTADLSTVAITEVPFNLA